ncbi:hypothetical protein L6164_023982 [Bauhinia variegata]|uniref:Uncharacterized protein n=1 Tax=Bauhinia variegata TaxID=167791 RepID=A0ACB9LVV1_BAUVA|nr:hypothetical protein L6164_023982 [Bauhinia variegata]
MENFRLEITGSGAARIQLQLKFQSKSDLRVAEAHSVPPPIEPRIADKAARKIYQRARGRITASASR